MAPVHHFVLEHNTARPPGLSAKELAIRVVRYFELHELSNKVLLQDTKQRDAISAQLQQQGLEVPMVAGAIQNQEEALKYYDEMLLLMPESFEDHYLRCHWASSAVVLVETLIVAPQTRADPSFIWVYNKALGKLERDLRARLNDSHIKQETFTPPFENTPSSLNRAQLISRTRAEALVADIESFMTSTFFFHGNSDEESGKWMPVGLVRQGQGLEYSILFDDCNEPFPQSKAEVIGLLEQSSKV